MLREFRDFVARGNVLDLAVAVIIGAAFATITTSLTEDVIMPVASWIFGGLDFSTKFMILGTVPDSYHGSLTDYAALRAAGVAMLGWGKFLTVIINFIILAFVIFLIVRTANRMKKKAEAAAPAADPEEVVLLREIRDALKKG